MQHGAFSDTACDIIRDTCNDVHESVFAWFAKHARDLPWRHTRDPWKILVAECMLQQTQVSRVLPKYHDFLARFPTVTQCADASLGEVLTLWSGLGYNRRASALHICAREVRDRFGGEFPTQLAALLQLRGIGPYTARAILVFAFEQSHAVVDTNIARILSRCFVGASVNSLATAQMLSEEVLPRTRVWEWNQALMDIGATICMKRATHCDVCPLFASCKWRGVGDDPATGSAGVTRPQSRFEGSFRQARGAVLQTLSVAKEPVSIEELVQSSGLSACRATDVRAAITVLETEGLVVVDEKQLTVRLP